MTAPEDALALARARVAQARERGGYAAFEGGEEIVPVDGVSLENLLEWAIVDIDIADIRSTRRFGGPITWVKRALVRFLRQYFDQATAQQQRFNIQLALYAAQLDQRLKSQGD